MLIAFLAVPAIANAFSQTTNFSHIKTGIVNYASAYANYLPLNIKDQVLDWQSKHFDIFVGGADITSFNPNALWALYKDHAYVYPADLPAMRTFAENNGFVFEDMLLHMKVDYQVSNPSYYWTNQTKGMDMFDVFEGAKGIFLLNGDTYVDKTTAAYNATIADVPMTDKILLGYGEPFAEINFILSTVAAGGVAVNWEYWNGSDWQALVLSSDGTNTLTQNGKIIFTPPVDWARKIENGSQSKWWVRATITGGTIKPTATKIYGDNWMSLSGSNNSRGWAANDPNIINKGFGELEYNPTPPTTATAKFRYQARATGMWAGGATFGNPANIQNGKRTFAAYLADWILDKARGTNYNAVMFDDAEGVPSISSPANAVANYSDYTDSHSGTFAQERIAQLQEEQNLINQVLPGFRVGKNTLNQAMSYASVWSAHESPYQAINTNAINYTSTNVSFDGYLPVNNPGASVGIMQVFDTYADGNTANDGNWFYWDRGNRGPMSALTSYYIGANDNTYFGYNSLGWSYWETDEFYYVSPSYTTLTQNLIIDVSTNVKNIHGVDFSAFPSGGTLGMQIGDSEPNLEMIGSFTKISNTQLQTTKPIHFTHNAGEKIKFVVKGHQAIDPIPTDRSVVRWANTFPAVHVNVGIPDVNGYNGGNRNQSWKLWSSIGGSAAASGNIWRRDYTNAIILHRPAAWNSTSVQFNTYSSAVDLGGMYYPLYANGTTGLGITNISLRSGEGAILMKTPIGSGDVIAPAIPQGVSVV